MSAPPFALRVPVDGASLSFGADGKLKLGGADATYTLPATPQAGRYLTTDAGGNLAWSDPAGAGDMAPHVRPAPLRSSLPVAMRAGLWL